MSESVSECCFAVLLLLCLRVLRTCPGDTVYSTGEPEYPDI